MEQAKTALNAFTSQYITSASLMADWLDEQLGKGNLGVHAALSALNTIIEDVQERQKTLAVATGDSIGLEHKFDQERTSWMREVVDLSKDRGEFGAEERKLGEGGDINLVWNVVDGVAFENMWLTPLFADPRVNVARSLLAVEEKVKKLTDVKDQLSEKWTHGPGGGYSPSSIYANAGGDGNGVFER